MQAKTAIKRQVMAEMRFQRDKQEAASSLAAPAGSAAADWPEKCRHCGTEEEPYWSRIWPMGYFCSKCGKPWTENDGVD